MSRERVVVGMEEPTMPETPPPTVQEPATALPGADVQLDRLTVAAVAARRAWDAVATAQEAWQVASDDLARAYADVAWLLDTPAAVAAERIRRVLTAPVKGNTPAQSRANGTASMLAAKAGSKHGTQEAQARAKRAAQAVAALERHGGDTRAAAAELGIKTNAFVMIVKHAKPAEARA